MTKLCLLQYAFSNLYGQSAAKVHIVTEVSNFFNVIVSKQDKFQNERIVL